jgi:hypothetical protein
MAPPFYHSVSHEAAVIRSELLKEAAAEEEEESPPYSTNQSAIFFSILKIHGIGIAQAV